MLKNIVSRNFEYFNPSEDGVGEFTESILMHFLDELFLLSVISQIT